MKKIILALIFCSFFVVNAQERLMVEPSVNNTQAIREPSTHFINWKKYKSQFSKETAFIHFPHLPAVSQSTRLLTVYAYDYSVLYLFNGYFPTLAHINPQRWFQEIITSMNSPHFFILDKTITQAENGYWIMDYAAHDTMQNLIIKGRAIVTPLNGYTLQCIKPNGSADHFDYFCDHFYIQSQNE